MSLRGLVILLVALVAGGCVYDVTGPDPDATAPAALAQSEAASPDGPLIAGIDVFKKTLESVTHLCSGATVNLDYREEATRRIREAWADAVASRPAVAENAAAITFDDLRLILRCHMDTDLSGYCVTDSRLSGRVDSVPAATSRPLAVEAAVRADGSFTCVFAAESVRRSVEVVLSKTIAEILADPQ